MSKDVPAGMLAHYALGTTTVAHAIKITRPDGYIFGMTEHDEEVDIDGVTYIFDDPGFSVSEIAIAEGCDVGNMQLTALHSGGIFTSADVAGGLWRNSRFLVFRYNHQQAAPITENDVDKCLAGTFGEVEMRDGALLIELHDLRRHLNHPVGKTRGKTCPYRLGSTAMENGGLCMKDISGAPYTVTFTVTSVSGTARLVFRDSALNGVHADDWFGFGEVEFTSDALAGIRKKVYSYDTDGTFTLANPTLLPIAVGMTGTAIAGCRGRFDEDCVTKYLNELNFGGEPHGRSPDTLTKPADAG